MVNNITEDKNIIQLGLAIKELRGIRETKSSFEFGSCVKLSKMEEFFKNHVLHADESTPSNRLAKAFLLALSTLASAQIRNTASVGGSIMWKHPSSDLMTLYIVLGCKIRIQQQNGATTDLFINDSFHSHNESGKILQNKDVITSLIIPKLSNSQYITFYKKSKRKEFALSIFNMAILLTHEATIHNEGEATFGDVKIVIGGTENPGKLNGSGYHKFATNTMAAIKCEKEGLRAALVSAISKDLNTTSEYKRIGTYRQGLAISYIEQFLATLNNPSKIKRNEDGLIKRESTQSYQKVSPEQPDYDEVERPVAHTCSAEQGKNNYFNCKDYI